MLAVIIDYGSGNIRSVAKALEKVAPPGYRIEVSDKSERISAAQHIILPGVGAFADCYQGLSSIPGMIETLSECVLQKKKPFLGICVGMQLLADKGLENGTHQGLGWISGSVVPLTPQPDIRIPHMGWNELSVLTPHPILAGITSGNHAYFVHSYHFIPKDKQSIIATSGYGEAITAAIAKNNIVGTQFHPEKSQDTGLKLLANFLQWDGLFPQSANV